jgi:hypothetical protein
MYIRYQGDQIVRIFTYCAFVFFWIFLEIAEVARIRGLLFYTSDIVY